MSTVSNVGAGTSTDTTGTSTIPVTAQKTLGQDDFLKLLAQQFQSQDPMKPMDDTSFIAQMAQFTSLQQSSAMAKDMNDMKAEQQRATANSYLGHRVTVDAGGGNTISGDVAGVEITDGTPRLVIGDYTYPVSSVLLVQPAAVTTSPANTTPATNP
jgi:flagellar basal-body rod modification protein FlgD